MKWVFAVVVVMCHQANQTTTASGSDISFLQMQARVKWALVTLKDILRPGTKQDKEGKMEGKDGWLFENLSKELLEDVVGYLKENEDSLRRDFGSAYDEVMIRIEFEYGLQPPIY